MVGLWEIVYSREMGVGALLGYWSCWMVEGWQLMDASKMVDDGWLEDGING